MALFVNDHGVLKCRFLGENLWLLPWGKDALRVVSRPMSEPELPAWALLEPQHTDSLIEITERCATIAVGKICLLYTSPSPRDSWRSRMPSSA